jgi:suppressor for copper-sensitivity B
MAAIAVAGSAASAAEVKKKKTGKHKPAAAAAAPAPPVSDWASAANVQLRLVSATTALARPDGTAELGLHVRLEPGWKFYWRTPGDAGVAPEFDWSESANLATADVRWPRPTRWLQGDLVTFGYEREVVLPITIQAEVPSRPVKAVLALSYGVCREICIPLEHTVSLQVKPGKAEDTPQAELVRAFAARVPAEGEAVGLAVESVSLAPGGLRIKVDSAAPFATRPDLILEGPEGIAFGPPALDLDPGRAVATWTVPVTGPLQRGMPLVLTLVDGERAVEAKAFVGQD